MKLKPKSTVKNPKAMVYKRFTEIDMSFNKNAIYKTADNKYWFFDNETFNFIETSANENAIIVGAYDVLRYQDKYFSYTYDSLIDVNSIEDIDFYWLMNDINGARRGLIGWNANFSNFPNHSYNIPSGITLANYILGFYTTIQEETPITGYLIYNNKKYTFSGTLLPNKLVELEATYSEDITASNSINITVTTTYNTQSIIECFCYIPPTNLTFLPIAFRKKRSCKILYEK